LSVNEIVAGNSLYDWPVKTKIIKAVGRMNLSALDEATMGGWF